MKKTYTVLPIGQHPFSKEKIADWAGLELTYEKGKELIESLSKSYPMIRFIMFGSVLEMTYKPEIVDFGK